MRSLLAAVLLLAITSAHAQPGDAWTRANEEFAAGRFREALELYQSAAQAGETTAALFYNIGNTHYRLGEFGQAILNYERALALDPYQPETQANLRLARDKARALELKRSAIERLVVRVTPTQYAITAAIAFWIAAFAVAASFWSRRRRASVLALAALGVATFVGAIVALYSLEKGADGRSLAIVTAPSIEARLATADSAGTVLVLPAGSEVKILSTRGGWSYAQLPNDLRGWIPANSAERVRL